MSGSSVANSIQTKVLKSGERIFYSLAKKQSQRKLSFNIRLLILVQQKYIGYIRENDLNKKDIQGSIDLNKIKKKVPLKDIRRIMNINKTVSITINDLDKANKQISLKWVFEMEKVKLAETWTEILEKQSSPFPSRKTTQHKERDNQFANQKPLLNKNPSIKQFAKQPQMQAIQPELTFSKQLENQKQKEPAKGRQSQMEPNNPKPMTLKEEPFQQPKQNNKLLAVKKQDQNKRESQLTFSFKGYQQANPSDDQQTFSPPKRQQKIQLPHPVLEKLKTMQSNLSTHLEQKIDLRLVEREMSQHKQSKIQKSASITNAQSRKQFMQLSSTFTNRQKQIEESNFNNYFRQFVGEINEQRYIDFYCFCQLKMEEIVSLDLKQYRIQDWLNYVRQKNGVSVQIIKTEIKQIPGNNNICDEELLKMYLNKQKNANYIWRIISNSEHLAEVFLLPMTCIAEYQGVTVHFQCTFSAQSELAEKSKDYSNYFQLLSQLTNINQSVLSSSSCIKFTKHNNKFVISEINQFLPRLFSTNRLIRAETFVRVSPQFAALQKGYQTKNNKKEEQQQNRYFKGSIQTSIQEISKNLDRLEEYVLHPSQFGPLMHLYGLNIVHIAEIYRRVQNSFIKSIIITEAAVRSFKAIYRKKMQQSLLELAEQSKEQPQKTRDHSHKIAKSLLNILLSKRDLSAKIWQMVTLHSQINFKLAVDKSEINKGYLFLGLGHHLGLKLDTVYSSCDKIFQVENFINAVEFVTKIKPCQLYWIDDGIYEMPVHEAAQALLRSLNMKNRQIPYYVHQDRNMSDKIYEIISLCYAPNSTQIKHIPVYREANECSEQTLHYFRRMIAEIKWQIKKQSELTMSLPVQSLKNVKQKIEKLKEELAYYFASYHPFYSEFYDLLLSLAEQSKDYPQMEEYSRLSMTNMIQLCGGNTMHLKLANNYYQKGDMYANWGKASQAIDSYKKAKNILEFNQFVKSKEYALVQLKLGELYLSKARDSECWKMLLKCFDIFCGIVGIQVEQEATHPHRIKKQEQGHADQVEFMSSQQQTQVYYHLIKCLQLLNRCSGSIPDKSLTLLSHSLLVLENWLEPTHPQHPLQIPDVQFVQMLKLFTQSYFNHMAKQISQDFFSYVERLCDQNHHIGNSSLSMRKGDLNSAITFIKQLIINAMLIEVIDGFSTKAKLRMDQINAIKSNGGSRANSQIKEKVNSKDLERFQQLMRAMIVSMGEAFVLGVLNDQHV